MCCFSFCHYLHLAEFACFGIRLDCCIQSHPVDPIALKLSGAQDKHVRYVSCAWSHVPRWGLKSTSAGLFSFEPKFSFNVFNIDITFFFFLRSVLIETKACCFICTESSNKKILSCFYRQDMGVCSFLEAALGLPPSAWWVSLQVQEVRDFWCPIRIL